MTLAEIHRYVSGVCPIVGLSGHPDSPKDLRIDFAPEATEEQKQAARDILTNWDDSVLPNPEVFITTLKNSPQFPLEFMPYLNMWTEADILNDVNRKAFWAKVKNSGAYFLTPEIIQSVEDLAIQCNLPLE